LEKKNPQRSTQGFLWTFFYATLNCKIIYLWCRPLRNSNWPQ
jgi:hypothetical protein